MNMHAPYTSRKGPWTREVTLAIHNPKGGMVTLFLPLKGKVSRK